MSAPAHIYDRGEETYYELVEELRRGGEGRIWRAWQLGAGGRRLPVAVKVLTPEDHLGGPVDKDAVLARWREQAQVMRSFSHDGFVGVQVVFRVADPPASAAPEWMLGLPAFVMAWADGPDLTNWSPREHDPVRRLAVLRRCAAGLDAFHREAKHLHRDIKPANVVVTGELHGRLVDYGLVRSVEQQRRHSTLTGTLGYLAPELLDGAPFSVMTDVYAFAAMIFHQLTLHDPPATSRGWSELARRLLVQSGAQPAASTLLAAMHPDAASRTHVAGATELLERVLACVAPRVVAPAAAGAAPAPPPPLAPAPPPARTQVSGQRLAVVGVIAFAMTLLFVIVAVVLTG